MSLCGGHNNKYSYFNTPLWLVRYAVSCIGDVNGTLSILEAGCAHAPFISEFVKKYGQKHDITGIDIQAHKLDIARQFLPNCSFIQADFLTWTPDRPYDIVISNPPYGIPGRSKYYKENHVVDNQEVYKNLFETWSGRYNIYGAFVEKAVNITTDNGKVIFVLPAGWLILDEFAKLRKFLASKGRLNVYYFGRIFGRLNVSAVLMVLEKGEKGLRLYDGIKLYMENYEYDGGLIRFDNDDIRIIESQGEKIGDLFDINMAARSLEFKRHPAVSTKMCDGYLPVLTGRNLHKNWIDYEKNYSGLWIKKDAVDSIRDFYVIPHLVVGHTKGMKTVAAIDKGGYAWREEFHLISKTNTTIYQKTKEYLNSEHVNKTLYKTYRDFINHITLTILKEISIP